MQLISYGEISCIKVGYEKYNQNFVSTSCCNISLLLQRLFRHHDDCIKLSSDIPSLSLVVSAPASSRQRNYHPHTDTVPDTWAELGPHWSPRTPDGPGLVTSQGDTPGPPQTLVTANMVTRGQPHLGHSHDTDIIIMTRTQTQCVKSSPVKINFLSFHANNKKMNQYQYFSHITVFRSSGEAIMMNQVFVGV